MMKIMAACGSGLGSSFMIEMNIQTILKDLGIKEVDVEHTDMSQLYPNCADIIVVAKDLAMSITNIPDMVVLNNILDKTELREKIVGALRAKNLIK